MQDELQAAPETETVTPVEGSELAPDTGESQEEKIEFSEDQQKVFKNATDKLTFKRRQQERESQDREAKLNARISELTAKIPEQTRPGCLQQPGSSYL